MKQFYATAFILIGILFCSIPNFAQQSIYGNFPYSQTFLSTTKPAEVTVPPGENAVTFTENGLQLTPRTNMQFGAIFINDRKFSSVNGVKIEFEYMVYGGTGADGFTVFFFNDTVNTPEIGANGAGIGYSYRRAILPTYASERRAGLTGAYLGIAFDSYGNFKETRYQDEEIIDGIGIARSAMSHVTLRGARGVAYGLEGMETGFTGYPVLVTQSTKINTGTDHEYVVLEDNGDYTYYSSNPSYSGNFELRGGSTFNSPEEESYRKAIIELYPRAEGGMYITVKIQHGTEITTVIQKYPYKSVTPYRERAIVSSQRGDRPVWGNTGTAPEASSPVLNLASAIPEFLRIGFAGATGRQNDIHVIKNLVITLPGAAEANDDYSRTGVNIPAIVYPFGNDVAYQGVISEDQVGDSSYINPVSFRFYPIDGSSPINNYEHQTSEGRWFFDTLTRTVTFTPVRNYMGEASIKYSIKGGLPGHTDPYDDEAYRSLEATITVNVMPQILAIPSSVLCGDSGVVRLELQPGLDSLITTIRWYKDGVLIPSVTGEIICIVTEPGIYTAQIDVSGNTYTSNSIQVTRDDSKINEPPHIYSEGELYNLCGTESFVELKILEDDLRPQSQTYLWFRDGKPLYEETGYEITVTAPGIYKVMVTEDNCTVFSNEREVVQGSVTDFKAPIIMMDPPAEQICNGNASILLYVSNYAEYGSNPFFKWYNGDSLLQSGDNKFFFATEAGSYTVKVTANGCSAVSAPVEVTVSPIGTIEDAVIASISGDPVLCGDNGIVVLKLVGGNYSPEVIYAWFKDGDLFSSHPDYQKSTIFLRDTGTYFLRVIDGSCSILSNEIKVTASESGELAEADFRRLPPRGPVCEGEGSIYLYIHNNTDYPDGFYRWMRGDEIIKESAESWYVATEAGEYTVIISVDECSIRTTPITLTGAGTEIIRPVISATIGDSIICNEPGVVVLKLDNPADFSGITGYQWFKDGVPVPGATHGIYIAEADGTYRLQVLEGNCSSISDDYMVEIGNEGVVVNIPELGFDPGLSICDGGTTQIKVTNADLFPNATYLWYKDNELVYTGDQYTYYADAPGTYFVQVYYNGCSSVSADSIINSSGNQIIDPEIGVEPPSAVICGANGAVIIRLKNYSSYFTPLYYQWYKNDEIIPGETSTLIVIDAAMGAGFYRLRIQNGYGCVTFSEETEVKYVDDTEIIKPVIDPANATIYPGTPLSDHVVITVTNVDPAVTEYLWYEGDELLRRDANTGTITYTTYNKGRFYVQALYGNDCSAVSNTSVIESSENNAAKPIIAVFPDSYEICLEDGVGVIEITNLSEYTDPTFRWMKKTPEGDSLVGSEERFMTSVSGTYYVIVIDHTDPENPLPSIPSNTVVFTQGSNAIARPVILSSGNNICGINGKAILYLEDYDTRYSAAARYRWLLDGNQVQFTTTPAHVTSVAGSYVLQVFDGECFAESVPKILNNENTNYPEPVIDFLGGDELLLCGDNATVILYITNEETLAGATFQWFRNEIPLAGETGIFLRVDSTNQSSGKDDYYRVQANFGDCSTLSNRKQVREYSSSVTKPVIERVPDNGNLCGDSASILLRVTNADELTGQAFYWFKDGTEIVKQGNDPTYEVTEPGSYTVYTIGPVCSAESDPVEVTLVGGSDIVKPEIITPGGDLCTGESEWLLLMTTPESAYTNPVYYWYHGPDLLTGENKPRLTASAPGEYRLQVIDGDCSAFSASVTIPAGSGEYTFKPVISAVGDQDMCDGGGRTLIQVNNYGNYPGATFNWYRGNTLVQSSSGYSYYAEEAGFYYVHIINAAGCSAVSSELEIEASASEIPLPVLNTIPSPPVLCGTNGKVILFLTDVQAFAGYSYQWYLNDRPIDGESGTVTDMPELFLTVSSVGSYRLRLIDGNCITFSDPVDVELDQDKEIEQPNLGMYPSNGYLCRGGGGVIIYVTNTDRFTPGSLYSWYRGNEKLSEGTDAFSYETDTTGDYYVRVVDGDCLAISDPVSVLSGGDSIAQPDIRSISDGYNLCGQESSVVLTIENIADYSEGATYQWFDGNNTPVTAATYPLIEIKQPGMYRVQVYDDGCSALSPFIEVTRDGSNSIDEPDLAKLPPDAQLCESSSNLILYVENHQIYRDPVYNWFRNNEIIEGENEYIFLVTEEGDYFVQVIEGECSATSEHLDIISHPSENDIYKPVIIGNPEDIYTVCDKDGVVVLQLRDTIGFSDASFYWYKEIELIPGENAMFLIVKDTGNYRLLVRRGECTAFSNVIKVGRNIMNEIDAPIVNMRPETGFLCGDSAVVFLNVVNENAYTSPQYRWFNDIYFIRGAEYPIYEANQAGDYFVQVVDRFTGCVSVSSPAKTVINQGSINQPRIVSTSGGVEICGVDGSILLMLENEDIFPGSKLQWYNGKDSIPGDTVNIYRATFPGEYRLLVFYNGCYAFSNTIYVDTKNTEDIVSPDLLLEPVSGAICGSGSSVMLSISNAGQYDNPSYHWFKDRKPVPDAHGSSLTVNEPGNYFVQVVTDSCSALSDTVSVYMGDKLDFNFANDTVCAPDSVDLTALRLNSGNVDGLTLLYYNKAFVELNSTYVHVTDTFFIIGTNNQGCADTSQVVISVLPQPEIDLIKRDTAVCSGSSLELLSMINLTMMDTVLFFADKAMLQPLISSLVHLDNDTVFYFMVMDNATGCRSEQDSLQIYTYSMPACTITGPDSLCAGNRVSYTAPDGMGNYIWDITGAGSIISDINGRTITVEANNVCNDNFVLILEIRDAQGCTSSCTATVIIAPSDSVRVSGPSDTTVNTCDIADQSALETVFTSWISRFEVTGSGCNAAGSFADSYTAPLLCSGDSVTVKYFASDLCSSDTITRVFRLSPVSAVEVSGPSDTTVNTCDFTDQSALETVFNSWISRFEVTGSGCNAVGSFADTYTAPLLCSGDSVTVKYYASDLCSSDTITRVFRLSPVSAVEVSGSSDTTVNICDIADQSALETVFNSWISRFEVTGSGCNAVGSFADTYTAPLLCSGDSVTVKYFASDLCSSDTITRVFRLTPVSAVEVSGPSDTTVNTCDIADQSALETVFTSWISRFEVTGSGCNAVGSFADSYTAPLLCSGDSVTVKYFASDLCSSDTITRVFRLSPVSAVEVSGPSDTTVNTCDFTDQSALETVFTSWISRFEVTGSGCNAVGSFADSYTSPLLCSGDSVTVKYFASDLCSSDTITCVFRLSPVSAVEVSGPSDTTLNICDIADQSALETVFTSWISRFEVTGSGCNAVGSFADSYTSPLLCSGDSVAVKYFASDLCSSDTITRVFRLSPVSAVEVSGPSDTTVNTCDIADQSTLETVFNSWISRFEVTGSGCNAVGSFADSYTSPLLCSGDSVTVKYFASDLCSSDTITRVFRLALSDSVRITAPEDTMVDICAYSSPSALDLVFEVWKSRFVVTEDGCGITSPDLSSYHITYDKCANSSVTIVYAVNDGCTEATATRTFTVLRDSLPPVITGTILPDTVCGNEDLPLPAGDVNELNTMGVTIVDNCLSAGELLLNVYDIPDNASQISYYTRYYVISDSCGNRDSLLQIIRIIPPSSMVYATDYCDHQPGGSIVLTGSEVGINYQLISGDNPVEAPKPGTGNTLTWSPVTEGNTYYIRMYYDNFPDCSRNSDTVGVFILDQPDVAIPRDTVSAMINSTIMIPVMHSGNTDMKVYYSVMHNAGVQYDSLEIAMVTPSPFDWAFAVPGDTGTYYIRLDSVIASSGCKAALDHIFTIKVHDCQSDDFHIVCPNDTILEIPYGYCAYDFGSIGYPTIIDMPENNLDTIIYRGPEGYIFDKGIHEIQWIAIDWCGKSDTCTQLVVVNFKPCGDNDTIYYFEGGMVMDSLRTLEAVDYEQNYYPTVRIGCDCWTAENLRSTRYADGTPIENSYIYYSRTYPDTLANLTEYGRLYDWYGAARQLRPTRSLALQGACPDGWTLPAAEHYERLIPYGSEALRMPSKWLDDAGDADNSTGFGALPAGYYNGDSGTYYYLLGDAYFWTSDRTSESIGKACYIRYNCPDISIIDLITRHGASVRCVKIQ